MEIVYNCTQELFNIKMSCFSIAVQYIKFMLFIAIFFKNCFICHVQGLRSYVFRCKHVCYFPLSISIQGEGFQRSWIRIPVYCCVWDTLVNGYV